MKRNLRQNYARIEWKLAIVIMVRNANLRMECMN